MTAEERFADNVRHIEAALARRANNGAELYHLCKELVRHDKVRQAAPLALSLIEDAVERYRRDNYEDQLAAVAKEMTDA
ncbi:hypothetical protein [Bradyrhizobium sp. SZCCHNRI1073]|uniref:hypothetical protein n=1 Tax=Bradyrhizobium sp. SZCCHNRI1073 TaxID=3057280 RepID=UPI0029168439|nr:hypothetical protein [Bradyrhizobium sp. SZCCHNRI1073]